MEPSSAVHVYWPKESWPWPCLQNTGVQQRNWRVSATGVVLQLDAAVRVMKKLKLVGTPFKVG